MMLLQYPDLLWIDMIKRQAKTGKSWQMANCNSTCDVITRTPPPLQVMFQAEIIMYVRVDLKRV